MKDYQYPLDLDWTTEEMVIVTNMWTAVEQANETGLPVDKFLTTYQQFKTVVKSIGEEKRLGRKFENASGYSLYRTLQQAKKQGSGKLKLGDD
ncbi:UPF0223 family protein [Enterococcus faecalis]|uniref:UPF0223 family protein n=1 Tax=Enterococcus faecalis TaxID=1351 RepID=UPI000CF0D757|nr:UPF0223 family protein [Enterococcus faecalis]EGO6114634.1 UPF0223 family protein [Enterococcus faecalis]EJJ1465327.1 UPF0223 family protein [Enterococcus faecalis]EME5464300.1 UPF0223 family protein [Enterococcus faecalis]PQC44823.1 hypothetical protein CUM89_05030 [Enterococcus faecalis]PQF97308.1 hypothetical protein CUS50_10790 [Enterococcus faecalis]